MFLKAAYSITPPYLPVEATSKGVDQVYIGMMFTVYSAAFAIVSPFIGKVLSKYGRRNMLVFGVVLMFIANIGFALMHYVNDTKLFSVCFVMMRIFQGIGTG